jgi:hypothetical protein
VPSALEKGPNELSAQIIIKYEFPVLAELCYHFVSDLG